MERKKILSTNRSCQSYFHVLDFLQTLTYNFLTSLITCFWAEYSLATVCHTYKILADWTKGCSNAIMTGWKKSLQNKSSKKSPQLTSGLKKVLGTISDSNSVPNLHYYLHQKDLNNQLKKCKSRGKPFECQRPAKDLTALLEDGK